MTGTQLASAAIALFMAATLGACNRSEPARPAADTGRIAEAVKADVTRNMADFDAHDSAKVAGHDAPGVVQMFHGTPNTVGPAADLAATQKLVDRDPTSHFTVAGGSVDVAASGDMAVYRSTYVYNFANPKTKKPVTEFGNYLAGYKGQPDGSWKIEWSVASDTPSAG